MHDTKIISSMMINTDTLLHLNKIIRYIADNVEMGVMEESMVLPDEYGSSYSYRVHNGGGAK